MRLSGALLPGPPPWPAAIVLCLAAQACTPEHAPQSLVDKFRVIAVKASPASGGPGDEIQLEALMSDTMNGGAPLVLWSACFPLPGQSGRQCLESLAGADTLEDRFTVLSFGLEPTTSFTLPDLAEGQEQTEIFIVLAACAGLFDIPECECPGPTCEECMEGYDVFDFCDGDDALVFKSVLTHADPTRGNQNPAIARIVLDGEEWAEDHEPPVPCDPEGECTGLELAVQAQEGSAETYVQIRFDEEVTFEEEPYVSWFATTGSMGKDRSSVEPETNLAEVRWTPDADEAGGVKFYFVMYDGRGGVDFAERRATVVP